MDSLKGVGRYECKHYCLKLSTFDFTKKFFTNDNKMKKVVIKAGCICEINCYNTIAPETVIFIWIFTGCSEWG
jgi:hypothetical protein